MVLQGILPISAPAPCYRQEIASLHAENDREPTQWETELWHWASRPEIPGVRRARSDIVIRA